ncbi:MAG: TOBE domain-containing protein [Desulfovibrionaceae bacterium]
MGGIRLSAGEVFTVPAAVRRLDPEQLHALEAAFDAWRDAARGAAARLPRERLRLVFLLLRHTGARLGEVLGLDESADVDAEGGEVRLGSGAARRTVPLPEGLCRELRAVLQAPQSGAGRGGWFKVDPGYVRRVFYARAGEAGVPRELATPRVLRNTRAVELLRSGVPLTVVRDVLGQGSADLTSVFQTYSEGAAAHLVRRLALSALPGRTSARNTFLGQVVSVRRDGIMAEVALRTPAGTEVSAVITAQSLNTLGLTPGSPVAATVKAPLVNVLRPGEAAPASARNRLLAVVTDIRSTEVVAEISGRTDKGEGVCALVSASSAAELDLREGQRAEFRFKALCVVLNTI